MTHVDYSDTSSNKPRFKVLAPKVPEKNVHLLNGRIIPIKNTHIYEEELQSELTRYWKSKNLLPHDTDNDDMDSEKSHVLVFSLDSEVLSKTDCIKQECLSYINQVYSSLTFLMILKEELDEEFSSDLVTTKNLSNIFRDIQSLKLAYQMIQETIDRFKSDRVREFHLHDVLLDPVVSNLLKMYKPFLNNYATIIKSTANFNNNNQSFVAACNRARAKRDSSDMSSLEQCLYTVFNSLFSMELMFDRYRNCFEESSTLFEQSTEAKNLISNILKDMNKSQDQETFLLTQKELSLMTGRSWEHRVNIRFIIKAIVTKLSRRDNKPLSRQLILFSDCLYVTLLPSNILGTSSVRQELSLESMKVSEYIQDGDGSSATSWGLTINAKEAVQDFFFENEQTLKTWRDHLSAVIKDGSRQTSFDGDCETTNGLDCLGLEAPRWQKDSAAGFCNGLGCSTRFSTAMRRHHCRADGLLYCDSCCNFKVKLVFERSSESRVCELCYNILSLHKDNPEELLNSRRQLNGVIDRKTRVGRKIGWLKVKMFSKEKVLFLPEVKYFCELQCQGQSLVLYERPEDKYSWESIDLSELSLDYSCPSRHFLVVDSSKTALYHVTAASEEDCQSWIDCLAEKSPSNGNH